MLIPMRKMVTYDWGEEEPRMRALQKRKAERQGNEDYGWGVRVRRHFGTRGRSSVRYGLVYFVFQLNTQHAQVRFC
jgi:hypothetical protein